MICKHLAPGWSPWSNWSECVVQSGDCGVHGKRSRHRTCDNPPPVNEHAPFCNGMSMEWANCTIPPSCHHSDTNIQITSPVTYTVRPGCQCGCTLNDLNGHLVAPSYDTQRTCPLPIEWLIAVPNGYVIKFQVVRGMPHTSDVYKGIGMSSWTATVRDGDLPMSNLLLSLSGSGVADGDVRPEKASVVSTGNRVRVEYYPSSTSSDQDTSDNFIAAYTAIDDGSNNERDSAPIGGVPFSQTSSFLIIVIMCPLIVVVLGAAAACLHLRQVSRRRLLHDKLDQSTPAHEALLPSASAGPSGCGPDAPGPSGLSTSSKHGGRRSHGKTPAGGRSDDKSSTDGFSDGMTSKERSDQRTAGRSSGEPPLAGASGLAPVAAADEFDDFDDDDRSNRRRKTKHQRNSSSDAATSASGERIRLERYDNGGRSGRKAGSEDDDEGEMTCMLEKRPPVEGASLTKDYIETSVDGGGKTSRSSGVPSMTTARYIPPARSTVAAVRDLRRPDLDGARLSQLPLLEDGARLDTLQVGDDLSPLTNSRPLFGDEDEDDEGRPRSPALSDAQMAEEVELEYDDYVPELPGSYFTMDPHAYTLTWSKQANSWDTAVADGQTSTKIADSDGGQMDIDSDLRGKSGQYYF